jgi:hypothetical protein
VKAKAAKVVKGLRKQQSGMIIILLLILALVMSASTCAFFAQSSDLLPIAAL